MYRNRKIGWRIMLISGIKTNDFDIKRPLQSAAALSFIQITYAFSFADFLDSTYMTAIRITRPARRGRKTFLVRPATM